MKGYLPVSKPPSLPFVVFFCSKFGLKEDWELEEIAGEVSKAAKPSQSLKILAADSTWASKKSYNLPVVDADK